ncbi:hypothetical protein H5410_022987 [Solanum commersonii]|uniref:Cytochrome P450 n=1 Tax=Solanum commersonii TaxID=4109 RepID=A0A9J5ZGA4_SOLCO|nr:hypothetical protein H5410_022987 [Solanum commersonii]
MDFTYLKDLEFWLMFGQSEEIQMFGMSLKRQNFQLLPFGSSRRSCPDLQLGLTIVRLVVAQLVHSFDWEFPNGMMSNDINMT